MNQAVARTGDDETGFAVMGTGFVADRIDSDYSSYCAIWRSRLWCSLYPGAAPYSVGRAVPNGPSGTTFGGPVLMNAGTNLVDVATGGVEYAYALTTLATAVCAFDATATTPFTEVAGLPPIWRLIGSGGWTTCGLAVADSTAWCWGPSSAPYQKNSATRFIDLNIEGSNGSGAAGTACGVRADSLTACWGGNGPISLVDSSLTFAKVVVGLDYACGLRSTAELYCWGSNSSITRSDTTIIRPKLMATAVTSISAGTQTLSFVRGYRAYRWGHREGTEILRSQPSTRDSRMSWSMRSLPVRTPACDCWMDR